MSLSKSLMTRWMADSAGRLPVVLEPLEGHSDEEILSMLRELDASAIELLAPGYISANVSSDGIERLQDRALVSIKGEAEPLALW
jgi:hypothetical protein